MESESIKEPRFEVIIDKDTKRNLSSKDMLALIADCVEPSDIVNLKIFLKAAKTQLLSEEYAGIFNKFKATGEKIITNPHDPCYRLFLSDCIELKLQPDAQDTEA